MHPELKDNCPYCHSEVDDAEIFSCFTTYRFVGGEMLYNRSMTCYERQLANLKSELAITKEELQQERHAHSQFGMGA